MYLFNCRSLTRSVFAIHPLSNRWVLGGVGITIILQLLYTYAPFMNTAFRSAPLDAWLWLPILGVGLVAFVVVEVGNGCGAGRRLGGAERAGCGRHRMSVECGGLTAAAPPERESHGLGDE